MDTTNISKEEQKRIDAINAHLSGEKPTNICKRMGVFP